MDIIHEIDLTTADHQAIKALRNTAFPDHTSHESYYKQLPHLRCLQMANDQLIGYMGLDYRVIGAGNTHYKVLGVIDLCIAHNHQGKGLASSMLAELTEYAKTKDVDFIILISDKPELYIKNGFTPLHVPASWLRIDQFKNYGVGFEYLDDFYIKPISNKQWAQGHVDWLGYMF